MLAKLRLPQEVGVKELVFAVSRRPRFSSWFQCPHVSSMTCAVIRISHQVLLITSGEQVLLVVNTQKLRSRMPRTYKHIHVQSNFMKSQVALTAYVPSFLTSDIQTSDVQALASIVKSLDAWASDQAS